MTELPSLISWVWSPQLGVFSMPGYSKHFLIYRRYDDLYNDDVDAIDGYLNIKDRKLVYTSKYSMEMNRIKIDTQGLDEQIRKKYGIDANFKMKTKNSSNEWTVYLPEFARARWTRTNYKSK